MDPAGGSEQDVLIKSIDFGTTFSAASYALLNHYRRSTDIRLGEFPTNNVHSIRVPGTHGTSNQVNTQMGWSSERQDFLWGDEVDQAIHNGDITEPDKSIESLKLALHKRDKKTEPQRAVIQTQLENLAEECGVVSALDLINIFFTKLLAHIPHKIRSARGNDIVARAKMEHILSVPALWEFEQKGMMI